MDTEQGEFVQFLRELAAEVRSESLSDVAARLAFRHEIAAMLSQSGGEGLRVLEEISVPVTPGALPGEVFFDFTISKADIEFGLVLVPSLGGELDLSRGLVESSAQACAARPSLEAVVYVWMREGLPATAMNVTQLHDCLHAHTQSVVAVPGTRVNPLPEVIRSLLAGLERSWTVPERGNADARPRGEASDVLPIVRAALADSLAAIRRTRYHLEERKAAAGQIADEHVDALASLVEKTLRSDSPQPEDIEAAIAAWGESGPSEPRTAEGSDD